MKIRDISFAGGGALWLCLLLSLMERVNGRTSGRTKNSDNQFRIVNGDEVPDWKWPFIVALLKQDKSILGGGTVMNEDTVLTAAHCLAGRNPKDIILYVGNKDISQIDSGRGYTVTAREFILHTEYNPKSYQNDIAIVKLKDRLNFDRMQHVEPICLTRWATEGDINMTDCYVMGWGMDDYGQLSNRLYDVRVPILGHYDCAKYNSKYSRGLMLCAGYLKAGRDACKGDSGGPLVCSFQEYPEHYSIQGIVSFGNGCAEPNSPGYYTKVTKYMHWIRKYSKA